mgnify:CR=1 FL=1
MNHSPLFYSIEGVLIQKLLLMAERKGSAVSYNELKINNLEDTEGEVTDFFKRIDTYYFLCALCG